MNEQLYKEHEKLIYSVTKKYAYYDLATEPEDTLSIATLGFVQALNGYKAERGVKFSTYAYSCILYALKGARRDAKNQKRYNPDLISLDKEFIQTNGSKIPLLDLLASDNLEIGSTLDLDIAVNELSEREKEIIGKLYGVFGFNEYPVKSDIAKELGISRVRLYAIKNKAFSKLREKLTA
jgi:RNA polymerase sporulation-specific sigma factor